MRWLCTPVFAAVMVVNTIALAQTLPIGASAKEVSALPGRNEPASGQDLVEHAARSERKRNAFLYIVAAGLAAIGTTYTLTRPRDESDED
jgi:hypothetical protein